MARITMRRSLLATTIIAGSLAAAPAYAQVATPAADTPAADDATIVVTGSLIRNPNLTSSSPVNVVGIAEIERRSPNTAEELLRSLPGVTPGIGTQVNNGSNGTNSVDLRGLGTQRNLVLLDGNRIVPTLANGVVDLNVIPLALVERVDVLTGGASTTYGADAVTGVVNFITKKNFSGVDARASYRVTGEGDGPVFRGDLTLGANFADNRGNAVISIGYTKADPVYQTRPFAIFGVSSTSGVASGASRTSVPTAIDFGGGTFLQLDGTGTSLVPQYASFNFNPYNIFQTPIDRKSFYAAANYEIADSVEIYARGMFVNNTVRSIIAPSGVFGNALTVPGNNPYLPTAVRDRICTQAGIALGAACNTNAALPLPAVYRRLVELGPRIGNYDNTNYDLRAGAVFDIAKSLKFDLSGAYGHSEQTLTNSGYVLNSRLQQALNANNTTTCIDTAANCVPVNLFGPAGSISAAQVAFLQGQSTVRIVTELNQVRGVLTGDFGFTAPSASAPVSFAVGAEYRKYDYNRAPDAAAQNPSELGGAGGAVLPFIGGYNVKEVFGELIAPIAAGQPFLDELSVEGGVRFSSYSVAAPNNPKFDATTYKVGTTWQPVSGLRFRANYQRAVRAPNINELFAPVVTGLTNLTSDPCAGTAPVGNANLTAVCIAQGATAASIGTIPNPTAGQANQTGGGNPNIRPEKADTFTVGVVLTPKDMIPGLSISVDYFDIRVNNAITSATPGDVINACFNSVTAASATSVACTGIRRNAVTGGLSGPTGTVPGLPTPLTNNGRLATSGIDLTFDYKRSIGPVKLGLNFVGTYTKKLVFQASPVSYARDCVGYFSANCGPTLGQIQPEITWLQRTTLGFGGVEASLAWRHLGAVRYEGAAADFLARGFKTTDRALFSGVVTNGNRVSSDLAGQTFDFNRIGAYDYFDLSVKFDIGDKLTMSLAAFNIFNRKPPIVGGQAGTTTANSGNTFPSTYDPLGRSYNASVRLKF